MRPNGELVKDRRAPPDLVDQVIQRAEDHVARVVATLRMTLLEP